MRYVCMWRGMAWHVAERGARAVEDRMLAKMAKSSFIYI